MTTTRGAEMSDEIKTALTAEEWTELEVEDALVSIFVDHATGTLHVYPSQHTNEDCEVSNRHALAALCLHDQPFGFTSYDVVMLRQVACCPHHKEACESIADRIEALLPPEDS